MKARLLILISIIIVFYGLYYIWIFPSIPDGINTDPLYTIKLNHEMDILSIYPDKSTNDTLRPIENRNNISITPDSSDTNVFRRIEICQFENNSKALECYESYKETFTVGFENRLYKEKGDDLNKFFIAYETTRLNFNHGFPIGILRTPNVMVGFLKNNLFISVSYTAYSKSGANYINEMNSDIIYVSKIIEGVIDNKPLKIN